MIIESIKVDKGAILFRFEGTKQGIQFTTLSDLKAAVQRAVEREKETRFLLAIRDYLQSDPNLTNAQSLIGRDA